MSAAIDLRPLKKWLERGDVAEIQHEIGVSGKTAANIIAGKSKNFAFVEAFLRRVEKNKALYEKAHSI